MYCKNCGNPLNENDQFCKNCGTKVEENQSEQNTDESTTLEPTPESTNLEEFDNKNQEPETVTTNNMDQNSPQQPTTNPQPMNNNSTPNNINIAPTTNQPKSNNKTIIAGVVAVAVIIIGLFAFTSMNKGDGSSGLATTSTYKVQHEGFTYKIPTNLVYNNEGTEMTISDEAETWAVAIVTFDGSFAKLKSNKNQIVSAAQQRGLTVKNVQEKNYAGVNFITFEGEVQGYNFIYAYAKANSMKAFALSVLSQSNEFDYSPLKTIAPILSSAEYSDESLSIAINNKADLSEINSLAQ